jgi:hypothetical protein
MQAFSPAELASHDDAKSCWASINGAVYDFTDFLSQHPGGRHALLRFSGGDATDIFLKIHDSSFLNNTDLGFKQIGMLLQGGTEPAESSASGGHGGGAGDYQTGPGEADAAGRQATASGGGQAQLDGATAGLPQAPRTKRPRGSRTPSAWEPDL